MTITPHSAKFEIVQRNVQAILAQPDVNQHQVDLVLLNIAELLESSASREEHFELVSIRKQLYARLDDRLGMDAKSYSFVIHHSHGINTTNERLRRVLGAIGFLRPFADEEIVDIEAVVSGIKQQTRIKPNLNETYHDALPSTGIRTTSLRLFEKASRAGIKIQLE